MAGLVTIKSNEPQFSAWVQKYAEAAIITLEEAFEAQGRLLCDRLMQLTPPLSGKSIKRGLWNRNIEGMDAYKGGLISNNAGDMKAAFAQFAPFKDDEIESMSARHIGERRVEKDVRKVVRGVRGAEMGERVIVSQSNHDVSGVSWAVRQKCQGKDAFRIYATKTGEVYGVDAAHFLPEASTSDLNKVHAEHRGTRGRVTTAGSKDVMVGRWRWLNIAVTSETIVEEFVKLKQKNVGQARGGWAAGYLAFGGKLSLKGWVGRHKDAGQITGWPASARGVIDVTITNNSAWSSNGDPDRIVENAIAGRERDIEKMIERILEARWGEGAAKLI